MKPANMEYRVSIPEKVTVKLDNGLVSVKGPKGEVQRKFVFKKISMKLEGNFIVFNVIKPTKREKAAIFTTEAHLKNMFKGVLEGSVYKLKICSGHFPMKVTLKGSVLEVKNFMGETVPRTLTIKPGVTVEIKEPEIIVTSPNKELAAQTAASIEQICRRADFDKRIFQDGIYITVKDGVELK
ncbi:MAG: 50S ribosomal protein L6 [Candidatus Woesearchaeota archaeon]|nr:MAG: 50S ribosomal protein L6 [Candidatus Woesearchaeota archaeon]